MTERSVSPLSRRHLGKLLLTASLAGVASRAWAQLASASQDTGVETRTLDELHKAALAEGGELLVYGGGDLPNGSAGTERAFNTRFPGMKLRILVDRSKYHHVRIDNQLALGRLACDAVHILSINAYDRWKVDGRLLPYKPAGWEQIYPDFKDPDGAYTGFTVFAFSSVYNTAQVIEADAPRDAVDFLNPKFKDRIVLSYPHDDDAILYQFDRIVAAHGWGYIDRLLAQNPMWVRGSAPARVAVEKGEKAVTFTASGPLVTPANATSVFVLPKSDSFLSWPQPFAIFKDARHPAAAKLYVNWLVSKEVQDRSRQWPVRRDAAISGGYAPVFAYNTYPAQFRTFLQDRVRLEKLRDQLEQFIGPMQGPNPTKVEGVFPSER
jgi:ABC-type Fe3+ transport system substrate-binding protein